MLDKTNNRCFARLGESPVAPSLRQDGRDEAPCVVSGESPNLLVGLLRHVASPVHNGCLVPGFCFLAVFFDELSDVMEVLDVLLKRPL